MAFFFNSNAVDPSVTASKQSFAEMFNEMYQQNQADFSNYTQATNLLQNNIIPMMMSGAIPYGFSPGLDSLLTSKVMQQAAIGTRNALNAAQLAARQANGGAALAPGGANDAINALIQSQGIASENAELLNKTIAGYQMGEQNLTQAGTFASDVAKTAASAGASTAGEGNEAAKGQLAAGEAAFQESEQGSILNDIMRTAQTVGQIESDVVGAGNIAGQFMNPGSTMTPQQLSSSNIAAGTNLGAFTPSTFAPSNVEEPTDLFAAGYGPQATPAGAQPTPGFTPAGLNTLMTGH